MARNTRSELESILTADHGLDVDNDLNYLLGIIGEALDDANAEHFADDAERAEWVIAAWSQELQYLPDLRDYDVGEQVKLGEVPRDLETARYREH